ncbi:P-loop containing nucleoside triphosphate hydrolase protein [Schizophyllum fasciatum]
MSEAYFLADDSPRPTQMPDLDAFVGPSWDWGNVVEIQGPPACGKTHLLYFMLVSCVLPMELGGWGKAAVLCDTDGTFDPLRFRQILAQRLRNPRTTRAEDATDNILRASLQRIHVFRPTTSNELAMTLAHLPAYHCLRLPDDEIGMLAIDSLSSFHWSDRFTVEQLRAASERGAPVTSPLRNVVKALRRFRDSHRPIILLTNWGLSPIPHTPFFEQHLRSFPSPFANPPPPAEVVVLPLTHHITLSRRAPRQLREGIALEEAEEQERVLRRPVSEKGEITGLVRIPGQADIGHFTLRIGPDGVHVKQDAQDAAIE